MELVPSTWPRENGCEYDKGAGAGNPRHRLAEVTDCRAGSSGSNQSFCHYLCLSTPCRDAHSTIALAALDAGLFHFCIRLAVVASRGQTRKRIGLARRTDRTPSSGRCRKRSGTVRYLTRNDEEPGETVHATSKRAEKTTGESAKEPAKDIEKSQVRSRFSR